MKALIGSLVVALCAASSVADAAIMLDSTATTLQLHATAGVAPFGPPGSGSNEEYSGNDGESALRSADTRTLAGAVESNSFISLLIPDLAAFAGGDVDVHFTTSALGIAGNGSVFVYSDPSYIDINGQGTNMGGTIWAPTAASGASSLLIGFHVSEAHAFSLSSTVTGPAAVTLSGSGGSLGSSGVLSPGLDYFLSAMTAGAAPGFGTCPDPGCDSSHKMFDSSYDFSLQLTAVPLPGAVWLLLSGVGAMGAFARRRRRGLSSATQF